MSILNELIIFDITQEDLDEFVYSCNKCKDIAEARYHCPVCEDFDLCVTCKATDGHHHAMEKIGFDLDDRLLPPEAQQLSLQEARELSIQRYIQSLVHACQCKDAECSLLHCQRMKGILSHLKSCRRRIAGGCSVCRQLVMLCLRHSRRCEDAVCFVPFCINVKQKMALMNMR